MSFGLTAAQAIMIAGAVASAATAGATAYSANKQSKATKQASKVQKQASDQALHQQQTEMNMANQKVADTESILESNTGNETQGTMLTGPQGITTLDDLILGRGTSRLGGM